MPESTVEEAALAPALAELAQLAEAAGPGLSAEAQAVLKGLDRPSPQVLIKVIFLEATYNKNSDIGLSGGYTHDSKLQGVSGVVGQGFGTAPITTLAGTVAQARQARTLHPAGIVDAGRRLMLLA